MFCFFYGYGRNQGNMNNKVNKFNLFFNTVLFWNTWKNMEEEYFPIIEFAYTILFLEKYKTILKYITKHA